MSPTSSSAIGPHLRDRAQQSGGSFAESRAVPHESISTVAILLDLSPSRGPDDIDDPHGGVAHLTNVEVLRPPHRASSLYHGPVADHGVERAPRNQVDRPVEDLFQRLGKIADGPPRRRLPTGRQPARSERCALGSGDRPSPLGRSVDGSGPWILAAPPRPAPGNNNDERVEGQEAEQRSLRGKPEQHIVRQQLLRIEAVLLSPVDGNHVRRLPQPVEADDAHIEHHQDGSNRPAQCDVMLLFPH